MKFRRRCFGGVRGPEEVGMEKQIYLRHIVYKYEIFKELVKTTNQDKNNSWKNSNQILNEVYSG